MIPQCKQNKIVGVSGDTLPIGSIVEWGSNVIPNNWLLCNGQAVSRTDYAELFNTIGTIYGTGDGSTTFNLPNFKGRVAVGKDDNDSYFNVLGKTGGEKEHVLTIEEMPRHNHNFLAGSEETYSIASFIADNSTLKDPPQEAGWRKYENIYIANTGESQSHNNLQPFAVTNFIIKSHQSAGVVAEVIQEDGETSNTNVYSADAVDSIVKDMFLTEEIKTNEVWIDGKPIYRKVIEFTVTEANKQYVITHNIANVEQIWLDCSNSFYDFNETTKFPLTFKSGENYVYCPVGKQDVRIMLTSWLGGKAYITLKYTKTTD